MQKSGKQVVVMRRALEYKYVPRLSLHLENWDRDFMDHSAQSFPTGIWSPFVQRFISIFIGQAVAWRFANIQFPYLLEIRFPYETEYPNGLRFTLGLCLLRVVLIKHYISSCFDFVQVGEVKRVESHVVHRVDEVKKRENSWVLCVL